MVVRRTEDEVLLPAGLDDAPEVTYTPAPGPAWLAPPPTVNAELAELEALPALRSRWLDKVILLGTGTSGQVPAVQCMTHAAALSPAREVHHGDDRTYQSCRACHDVLLHGSLSRNRRTCTAAVVVGGPEHVESVSAPGQVGSPGAKRRPDQTTILIDCGPTFYEAACKAWAAHDLREIDAVLLTHGHADAVLGLDHLRAWTIGHAVQSHVDVYLSQTTYDVVSHMFPYLADPAKATGGGGVGQLRWHIIDPQEVFTVTPVDKRKTPVSVVPLPVHHGLAPGGDKFQFVGWRVGEMSYVSDCSEIPASTAARMRGSEVLVLDALKWNRHLSHYSIAQALQFSLQLANPLRHVGPDAEQDQHARLEAAAPRVGDRDNRLKLVLLTDLTHHIEHWTLAAQLHQWEADMRLIAELATARVEQAARAEGREAAAQLRDDMVRACPDVHAWASSSPPRARGAYRNIVHAPRPSAPDGPEAGAGVRGAAGGAGRRCWWQPFWAENESERDGRLSTGLSRAAVRAAVLEQLARGHERCAPAFHVPAFRVAYDQQAIAFR